MSTNLLKSIMAGIVIAVLAMAAAPVMAVASMDSMTAHCNSNPPLEKVAIPNCCLAPDCSLFPLSGIVDKKVILFSSPTGNNAPMALNPIAGSETTSPCKKPPPHDPTREFPSPLNIKYQCRNSLNSDDPFSL